MFDLYLYHVHVQVSEAARLCQICISTMFMFRFQQLIIYVQICISIMLSSCLGFRICSFMFDLYLYDVHVQVLVAGRLCLDLYLYHVHVQVLEAARLCLDLKLYMFMFRFLNLLVHVQICRSIMFRFRFQKLHFYFPICAAQSWSCLGFCGCSFMFGCFLYVRCASCPTRTGKELLLKGLKMQMKGTLKAQSMEWHIRFAR